ncbi:MAG: hypothetical protein CK425_06620 [Parachlamydia sp.]|nr:MAG: hypothetical protein CK425_06620 [Parachlamydia sp.]
MNESTLVIVQMLGMLALVTLATFLIYKEIVSKLKKSEINLTKENKKDIRRIISYVIGTLTVYFSLLRLLTALCK